MLSTRLFPGSPNWAMNILFPHIGIPPVFFVLSIAIGLIPWNFLTCQAGSIIGSFKSKSEIFQPDTYYMVSINFVLRFFLIFIWFLWINKSTDSDLLFIDLLSAYWNRRLCPHPASNQSILEIEVENPMNKTKNKFFEIGATDWPRGSLKNWACPFNFITYYEFITSFMKYPSQK